ncbi:MAG: GNAT family N-acetyltransferase [Ruminococcus sp.]|nr:GNAT family N-acetyltransferase [Ruminococcus sp.]
MRLRPFILCCDFDEIKNWISDEKTHAMWCANRIKYPIEKENFEEVMLEAAIKSGDIPYVATTDDGKVVGFFCYSVNLSSNEGMLKFVMVTPEQRGKGLGKAMLQLAIEYAFNITKAESVQLNVFSENTMAQKCYENVGFIIRKTDIDAFIFKDESWGRCNMTINKAQNISSH